MCLTTSLWLRLCKYTSFNPACKLADWHVCGGSSQVHETWKCTLCKYMRYFFFLLGFVNDDLCIKKVCKVFSRKCMRCERMCFCKDADGFEVCEVLIQIVDLLIKKVDVYVPFEGVGWHRCQSKWFPKQQKHTHRRTMVCNRFFYFQIDQRRGRIGG